MTINFKIKNQGWIKSYATTADGVFKVETTDDRSTALAAHCYAVMKSIVDLLRSKQVFAKALLDFSDRSF